MSARADTVLEALAACKRRMDNARALRVKKDGEARAARAAEATAIKDYETARAAVSSAFPEVLGAV